MSLPPAINQSEISTDHPDLQQKLQEYREPPPLKSLLAKRIDAAGAKYHDKAYAIENCGKLAKMHGCTNNHIWIEHLTCKAPFCQPCAPRRVNFILDCYERSLYAIEHLPARKMYTLRIYTRCPRETSAIRKFAASVGRDLRKLTGKGQEFLAWWHVAGYVGDYLVVNAIYYGREDAADEFSKLWPKITVHMRSSKSIRQCFSKMLVTEFPAAHERAELEIAFHKVQRMHKAGGHVRFLQGVKLPLVNCDEHHIETSTVSLLHSHLKGSRCPQCHARAIKSTPFMSTEELVRLKHDPPWRC